MKSGILSLSLFIFVFSYPVYAGDDTASAGNALRYLLPVAAAGMTLLHHDAPGALQFGKSSVLTAGVTYGLKQTINEHRPNGGDHSFPSGHAAISFSSAEFIRKRYGCNIGCPAYVAAVFVGVSRVASREHFLHDVLAGAAIGIASSAAFTHPYKGWYIISEGNSKGFGMLLTRLW
jgi:membrane-associated phospholipid phosphatase